MGSRRRDLSWLSRDLRGLRRDLGDDLSGLRRDLWYDLAGLGRDLRCCLGGLRRESGRTTPASDLVPWRPIIA